MNRELWRKNKVLSVLEGWEIEQFCVGSETDESGNPYTVDSSQTDLKDKLLTKSIESKSIVDDNSIEYICKLSVEDIGTADISEFGLVDNDGDVVFIKTFPPKHKTDDKEMIFRVQMRWV